MSAAVQRPSGALAGLNPGTLDRELNRLDVERREEIEERGVWLRGNPYLNQEYAWTATNYKVWDELRLTAGLRDRGIVWTESCEARGMEGDWLRWMVMRAWRRDVVEEGMGANMGLRHWRLLRLRHNLSAQGSVPREDPAIDDLVGACLQHDCHKLDLSWT